MFTRSLAVIGLSTFALAANAVPMDEDLTLSDVSDRTSTNPEDIQCIIFGNSCPGGQQTMSALNYQQRGNVSEFDLDQIDNNDRGHGESVLQTVYTVGYLASFVGQIFDIGIDVNTAAGQPAERLLDFEVWVEGDLAYSYKDGATSLAPAFNGNGYFDFLLSTVDLSMFGLDDEVKFRANWDQATNGPENFFVVRQVSVPEPSTLALILTGLTFIGLRRKLPKLVNKS